VVVLRRNHVLSAIAVTLYSLAPCYAVQTMHSIHHEQVRLKSAKVGALLENTAAVYVHQGYVQFTYRLAA
jgi:hypothetical protein